MLCLRFEWVIVPSLMLYIYVICCSVIEYIVKYIVVMSKVVAADTLSR